MTRRPTPAEQADSAAIAAFHARLNSRAEAAGGLVLALALGILGAWALLHWLEPCADLSLCTLVALARRRVRSGSVPPPPLEPPLPAYQQAVRAAWADGESAGERHGYVAGWWWGLACGVCLGALLVVLALQLGLAVGAV